MLLTAPSRAWNLPEHVKLSERAVADIAVMHPAMLTRLATAWWVARQGGTQSWPRERLCVDFGTGNPIWPKEGETSGCVGFPTLTTLAADHSCSPADLARILGTAPWLINVLAVGKQAASQTEAAKGSVDQRMRIAHMLDLDLQREDEQYVFRAAGTDAHFQLARSGTDLHDYLRLVLAPGQTPNATALWVNYHAAALLLALAVRHDLGTVPQDGVGRLSAETIERVRNMLLAEAFAVHFLEEGFSASHITGTWGSAPQRKGTHDYYGRHGLEAQPWCRSTEQTCSPSYVAYGDAFQTDPDLEHGAAAVRASLLQLALVLDPQQPPPTEMLEALRSAAPRLFFNACEEKTAPGGLEPLASAAFVLRVVARQPMPGPQVPPLPRAHNEFGPFIGDLLALESAVTDSVDTGDVRVVLRGRGGVRVGVGLNDLFPREMDNRIMVDLFVAAEQPIYGAEHPIVGFGFTARAPFAVVPFDALLTAPLGLLLGFQPATDLLLDAAEGSIYGGFERPIPLGGEARFQIVAFRQLSLVWYPTAFRANDRPSGTTSPSAAPLSRIDLLAPVASVVLGHAYGGNVANELSIELGFQGSRVSGAPTDYSAGGYLSLVAGSRWYPW
jgi:hypothetical protein